MQDIALPWLLNGARLVRVVLLSALVLMGGIAQVQAEVWGYVDEHGQAHVSDHQLDTRYQLFFRGDPPSEPTAAGPSASETPNASAPKTDSAVANPAALHRFEQLIEQHAARESVDPALIKAIVAVESGFAPHAVSPKGALGLMQVMPQTAARYGVTSDKRRTAEEKLFDPAVNIRTGTRYLRDLLARFADNISLAVAAYNAGENAVERYQNRIPPYRETVEYVKRVQALYAAFRPPEPPTKVATATPEASPTLLGRKRIKGTFFALPGVAQNTTEPVL